MKFPLTFLITAGALVALPTAAEAATLATGQPCYIEQTPMQITGTGWPAGGDWSVQAEQIYDFGTADPAGNFVSTAEVAPIIPAITTKPKTFTLTGSSAGQPLATTTFQSVNFLVKPKDLDGKPTGKTRWNFSGFLGGKSIFVHVRRGGRTWTARAGKAAGPCGTLKTRLRRLPAVPSSQIRFGTYKVFVDNRRTFSKGGLQFPATIRIYRTFS
jgi:hypothetical protein